MSVAVIDAPSGQEWTLPDLIGIENLQAIQDAFASAFGLPAVIVDLQGRNVTEITHRVTFCEDLTRLSPGGERCRGCDLDAMRRAEATGKPAVFHCWNGLFDSAVPILSSSGELFGHFLCGQVFVESQDVADYAPVADELGIDPDVYVRAAAEVQVVPVDVFERSVEAMGLLARMIADQVSAARQNLETLREALEANAATERLTAELDTVVQAAAAIGATDDSLARLDRIAESLTCIIPHDSCIIFDLEPGGQRLRPVTVRDPYAEQIGDWRPAVGSGIPGSVAATGLAVRIDDVASDPLFEPFPGVPIEPVAILAVPMLLDGDVVGVIVLTRFEQPRFSEHELDLLKILASQSASALGRAAARVEAGRRLELERAQTALLRRIAAGGSPSQLLGQIVDTAVALLDCDGGACRLEETEFLHAPICAGVTANAVDQAARRHPSALEGAREWDRPIEVEDGRRRLLVAPVQVAGGGGGALLLWRSEPFADADVRLVGALAQEAAVVLENARIDRSHRRLAAGVERLAELEEAAGEASDDLVLRMLAERAHELVGAGAAFVALARPAALEVWRRQDGVVGPVRIETSGRPRLRLPEFEPSASAAERERLLDSWAAVLAEAVWPAAAGYATAVPLRTGGRALGALVAVGDRPLASHERALLSVLAMAAGRALAARAGDHDLGEGARDRASALAQLTELEQGVAAARDEESVVAALVEAFHELSGRRGAALAVAGENGRIRFLASFEMDHQQRRRLLAALPTGSLELLEPIAACQAVGVPLSVNGRSLGLLVAPAGNADLSVLARLGRFGGVVLENARLLEGERRAGEALQRQHHRAEAEAKDLGRSLSMHQVLFEAVLSHEGLATVAETLVRLCGGRVAIYDHGLHRLAAFPDDPTEEDPLPIGEAHGVIEIPCQEGHVAFAAPIWAGREQLGWIVLRLARAGAEVDRVAVGHAAVAAAVAILRERTAHEVEAGHRGEFLDSLFAGDAADDDDLIRRGRAIGYDLTAQGRVALLALDESVEDAGERLYRAAAAWAERGGSGILVGRRAAKVAAVGPIEGDWPRALHASLSRTLGPVTVGVGSRADAPAAYRESFAAAAHAVRVLRTLGRDGILALDEEGLDQLLLLATEPARLIAFVERYVQPLQEYDTKRTSALVQTLECVFEHGWNLQAAARAAHVHPSTLRYRLARVETLVGVSLERPDERLALQLALRTARLLGR